MTQTLQDLKSGKLLGAKTLTLACGLETFPDEIFSLADTLEILDLSDNNLSELPENFGQLKHLKIIFFARNKFTAFPKVLATCNSLKMIGFKSNQIETVPENSFPKFMNWLILTDNKIKALPKSIGKCQLLQKFLIAGNQLTHLPAELQNCKNLELVRIAANKLTLIPDWLVEMPKLSWLAFGGNKIYSEDKQQSKLTAYDYNDFDIKEVLGEGASGIISKAIWKLENTPVALKIFRGSVTSDGLPDDEMQVSIAAGIHKNLIPVLGKIINHPEHKSGLILQLISPDFITLGNPPSLDSCTRDTFDNNTTLSATEILNLAKNIASVAAHLHKRGINHGDLYAHNILIASEGKCIFSNFGAASFYDKEHKTYENLEKIEVRAYACFLEDILGLITDRECNSDFIISTEKIIKICKNPKLNLRPDFIEISQILNPQS